MIFLFIFFNLIHKVIAHERNGVYVYDPSQFWMYTKCERKESASSFPLDNPNQLRHGVDWYFQSLVTSPSFLQKYNVSGDKASLFIVPVLCSRSTFGKCGDHTENVLQMKEYLSKSEWFIRNNGSDHLIVCDFFLATKVVHRVFPNFIIGHKEPMIWERHGDFSVGYTTFSEKAINGHFEIYPFENRKYDFIFVGRSTGKEKKRVRYYFGRENNSLPVYYHRHALICDYSQSKVKPQKVLILSPRDKCQKKKKPDLNITIEDSMQLMANSRTVAAFTGDTPTSDRIFNAFETDTVMLLLQHDKKSCIEHLPFNDVIPWEDIFIIIPDDEFNVSAALAMAKQGSLNNIAVLNEKLKLMKKYKADVLWTVKDTRAHLNTIQEAQKIVRTRPLK